MYVFDYLRFSSKTREMRSHNKVRALFEENKVRFARAEQLWYYVRIRKPEHLLLHTGSS